MLAPFRLAELADPTHLDETIDAIAAADAARNPDPPEVRRARHVAADAARRVDQLMAALEHGLDADLAVTRIRKAQSELAAANAVIANHAHVSPEPLKAKDVQDLLIDLGSLEALLAEADANERRRIYQAAGVNLSYCRSDQGEFVRASLRVGFSRVGGATQPLSAHPVLSGQRVV